MNLTAHFQKVLDLIRTTSPSTLVTGYREWGGDLAVSYGSLNLFRTDLKPNTTSMATVSGAAPYLLEFTGNQFFPLEQVGICMQQGPDGNSNGSPTYWFEHPLVGHSNASRIFDGWRHLIGHGETGMINIAPGRTGKLRDSYLPVMADVGKAIRDTFTTPIAALNASSSSSGTLAANCSDANAFVLELPALNGGGFDYIETKEDLTKSQRIMQYAIEYRTASTPEGVWLTLVPPVAPQSGNKTKLQDRPAGFDQRDQYVGFRRIDEPIIPAAATAGVRAIRFRCLRSLGEVVFLRSLAVYRERVPWRPS